MIDSAIIMQKAAYKPNIYLIDEKDQPYRLSSDKLSEKFKHIFLYENDMGNNIGFKTNTAAGSPGLSHQNKTFSREVGAFISPFKKVKEIIIN